jgi:hypothetical protein
MLIETERLRKLVNEMDDRTTASLTAMFPKWGEGGVMDTGSPGAVRALARAEKRYEERMDKIEAVELLSMVLEDLDKKHREAEDETD